MKKDSCILTISQEFLLKGCHVDVTDKVDIGDNVVFGGEGTQLWTHGFDQLRNMRRAPVILGNNIYVSSRMIFSRGGKPLMVVDGTMIGAGTVISKSIVDSVLYLSNQLICKKKF